MVSNLCEVEVCDTLTTLLGVQLVCVGLGSHEEMRLYGFLSVETVEVTGRCKTRQCTEPNFRYWAKLQDCFLHTCSPLKVPVPTETEAAPSDPPISPAILRTHPESLEALQTEEINHSQTSEP